MRPDGVGSGIVRPGPKERRRVAAALIVGLGYSVLASFTHPFTLGADLVTTAAIVTAAVATTRQIRNRRRAPGGRAAGKGEARARWTPWALAWAALAAAATAWELFCYVSEPRTRYPTLSVLIDSLDSTRLGKTVAFAAWLALGFFLVTR